jgi:hypothetical protein
VRAAVAEHAGGRQESAADESPDGDDEDVSEEE